MFPRHRTARDGYRGDCRACNTEQARQRRLQDPEAARARGRARYADFREQIVAERRDFREANRERINAQRRAARAAAPERFRETQRRWYSENRETVLLRVKERGFRRRWADIDAIVARDGLLCGICSEPLDPATAHVDHIDFRALGGSNELANLRLAHAACNQARQPRRRRPPDLESKASA